MYQKGASRVDTLIVLQKCPRPARPFPRSVAMIDAYLLARHLSRTLESKCLTTLNRALYKVLLEIHTARK